MKLKSVVAISHSRKHKDQGQKTNQGGSFGGFMVA